MKTNENLNKNYTEIPETILEILAKRIYEEFCGKYFTNTIDCNSIIN